MKEVVDAQVNARTKTVDVMAVTEKLTEAKVKRIIDRKGFPLKSWKKVEAAVLTGADKKVL